MKMSFVVAGLLACMLLGGTYPVQAGAPRAISDTAALQAALLEDLSGQTLVLAPGTYDAIALRGAGTPAAITSADSQDPAVIHGISASDFEDLKLEHLVLSYRFSPGDRVNVRPFRFSDCDGLEIVNSHVVGDQARGVDAASDGYGYGIGLSVQGCRNVRVESNHISVLHRGMVFSASANLTIADNELTQIRSDGLNFAQVSDVRIVSNHIHNFDRSLESGDHADMIQFWTNLTTEPSENIVIRDNILNTGEGLWTQSIFMRNDLVDRGLAGAEMFYRNVRIENNLIINAHTHGITVGETMGLRILQNTMIQNASSATGDVMRLLFMPQIHVSPQSRDVRIEGNITHNISGFEDQPDWRVAQNLIIQNAGRMSGLTGLHYSMVFDGADYLTAPGRIESWRFITGGAGDQPGLGSTLLP